MNSKLAPITHKEEKTDFDMSSLQDDYALSCVKRYGIYAQTKAMGHLVPRSSALLEVISWRYRCAGLPVKAGSSA